MKHLVAEIHYDPEAAENQEWTIALNELGVGMLATLTDFELKVCAAELGIRVRNAFEMPPSPERKA